MIKIITMATITVTSLYSTHGYLRQLNLPAEAINNISATYCVNQNNDAPRISFDRMEYDFGTIAFKSKPKSIVFKFKNTGNSPLVITRTELSCTCLSVDYPRKPVMPGADGELTITYTPKKETGKFNNTVKIFSNSSDRRPTILFLRVNVVK